MWQWAKLRIMVNFAQGGTAADKSSPAFFSSSRENWKSSTAQLAAALSALALYCGDPALGQAIGVNMPAHMLGTKNFCAGTTLGGRDDLKRHFVISAGLTAVRDGAAAIGMGELKELFDSNAGRSGFSFDDMAANAAGVAIAGAGQLEMTGGTLTTTADVTASGFST